jgi:UTP-glucose-1-phosphate uridylyltransferase
MKIRKAVSPVAGFGTRFLPATKAMPKELLPIVDKPLIQYAAEEAIAAGIDTLIFVTGRNKCAIEDHFDANNELETMLRAKGKDAQADMVRNIIPAGVECISMRQAEQLGLGHAVLCAERAVGDDPFAVLLAPRARAQDVKKAVELLKSKDIPQAEIFPKDHRPWGWFESLALGECFQVKRILVKPGAALSLQSHNYRSEHWIVVEGRAKVTVDGEVKLLSEGQSIYVPLGAKHRMENPGSSPMVLIEVQVGTYLGEDDIVRYEDIYTRN